MNSRNINKTSDMMSCCHKVCKQLNNQKEYHFTLKMIMELIGPLIIFIAGLVVFKAIFAEFIKTEQLQTAFSFLISSALTVAVIVFIKKINKPVKKS